MLFRSFDSAKALKVGLVHEVVDSDLDMDIAVKRICRNIKASSPKAIEKAKTFLNELPDLHNSEQSDLAIKTLADIRVSSEAQEGIEAFLEKRKPYWVMDS